MQYKAHEQYIDANDTWLDKYPTHWTSRKLKFAVRLINEKIDSKESELEYLGLEHIESWTGKKIQGGQEESEGLSNVFKSGDVLFGKLRPYLAKVYKAESDGLASSEALILRASEISKPDFLKYFLLTPAFINVVNGSTYGVKMPRASWDFIGQLSVLLPPLEEQNQIAAFLDNKTRKIDILIKKKKELIEKIEEQRIAVITQAVTKGIDENAKLKPSGIEWLGDVPEHWVVTRTKFNVSYIGSGKTPSGGSEVYVDDGIIMLRSQNVYDEGLRVTNVVRITEDADRLQLNSRVNEHDVLLNITGASIGRVSIVPVGFPVSNVNQHVCIVRPEQEKIDPRYLHLQLCSNVAKHQIWMNQVGTSREGLNFPQVGDLTFSLPDLVEQQSILKFCEIEMIRNKQMKVKVETAIAKLEEYRSAIITSAVTGKIDVREIEVPKDLE